MEHISVLLDECIEYLNIKPDGVYLDGTLGLGGHSEGILRRLGDKGRLISVDRDDRALEYAGRRLAPFGERSIRVKGNFADIGPILDELGIEKVDGMMFDLGVSSPQLDDAARGFSYMKDAPLDMRMDEKAPLSAWDVVNGWSEEELRSILWKYGEERYSGRIASAIVRRRESRSIESTLELADIIRSAMPAAALREKQHPAKRSFQAIRIAVNDELGSLEQMLQQAENRLAPGGRLLVISFHSLEDRIVKEFIRSREDGCTCPKEFPVCVCGFKPTLKSVTRKPVMPGREEVERNPRARSSRLRIAERI